MPRKRVNTLGHPLRAWRYYRCGVCGTIHIRETEGLWHRCPAYEACVLIPVWLRTLIMRYGAEPDAATEIVAYLMRG